jgi:FkbM family methyltransferase
MPFSTHDLTRAVKAWLKDLRGPWAYRSMSYAQEGEDAVLMRIFGKQRRGFYVDIGCHHPHRFSNTYAFYRRGWRGICVDPLPGVARRFRFWRPRDIALELGISETPDTLTYHLFNEPAINTFSAELAQERDGINRWRIVDRRQIPTLPLATVIERHLPGDVQRIDLLSVDVEGLDLQVLRSNDWQRYRPRVVVAECLKTDVADWPSDPVVSLMRSQAYRPVAKTVNSVFFMPDDDAAALTGAAR